MANKRRRLVGRVVSDKMDKTVVVEIQRRRMHRVYKKVIGVTDEEYQSLEKAGHIGMDIT